MIAARGSARDARTDPVQSVADSIAAIVDRNDPQTKQLLESIAFQNDDDRHLATARRLGRMRTVGA